MPDLKIDKIYKMGTTDWIPLIDAMGYLSHLPQCGDVAQRLHDIFVAAKEGKYYFICPALHGDHYCLSKDGKGCIAPGPA